MIHLSVGSATVTFSSTPSTCGFIKVVDKSIFNEILNTYVLHVHVCIYIFRYLYLYVCSSINTINRYYKTDTNGYRQIEMGVDECVWVRWGAGDMMYTKTKQSRYI